MIHLNDTKADLGSRMDRHEHLGAGQIGPEGLAAFLRHPLLARTAFIIETPGMEDGYDAINLRRAEAIAVGAPRSAARGSAHLRGSRSRAATPPAAPDVVASDDAAADAGDSGDGRAALDRQLPREAAPRTACDVASTSVRSADRT